MNRVKVTLGWKTAVFLHSVIGISEAKNAFRRDIIYSTKPWDAPYLISYRFSIKGIDKREKKNIIERKNPGDFQISKISQHILSVSLKSKLIDLSKSLSLEIVKWKAVHCIQIIRWLISDTWGKSDAKQKQHQHQISSWNSS